MCAMVSTLRPHRPQPRQPPSARARHCTAPRIRAAARSSPPRLQCERAPDAAAAALPGTLYNGYHGIAGVFVCVGVYIMFLTERVSLDAMAAGEEKHCLEGSAMTTQPKTDLEAPEPHSHEHLSALSAAREILATHKGHAHGGPGAPAASAQHGHSHAHGALVLSLDSEAAAPSEKEAAKMRRRLMTARLLEVSIVVHSFIIGLNLGTTLPGEDHHEEHHDTSSVTTTEVHTEVEDESMALRATVALVIVLCFHQFFEGIALGSYIAELRNGASVITKVVMSAIFALTVPAGTWIGIGVTSAYSSETQTAFWVTGTLNALTGGMLLYSALITFMAEEFSRDDVGGAAGRRLKRQMYSLMLFGAACMALLGIWA